MIYTSLLLCGIQFTRMGRATPIFAPLRAGEFGYLGSFEKTVEHPLLDSLQLIIPFTTFCLLADGESALSY